MVGYGWLILTYGLFQLVVNLLPLWPSSEVTKINNNVKPTYPCMSKQTVQNKKNWPEMFGKLIDHDEVLTFSTK